MEPGNYGNYGSREGGYGKLTHEQSDKIRGYKETVEEKKGIIRELKNAHISGKQHQYEAQAHKVADIKSQALKPIQEERGSLTNAQKKILSDYQNEFKKLGKEIEGELKTVEKERRQVESKLQKNIEKLEKAEKNITHLQQKPDSIQKKLNLGTRNTKRVEIAESEAKTAENRIIKSSHKISELEMKKVKLDEKIHALEKKQNKAVIDLKKHLKQAGQVGEAINHAIDLQKKAIPDFENKTFKTSPTKSQDKGMIKDQLRFLQEKIKGLQALEQRLVDGKKSGTSFEDQLGEIQASIDEIEIKLGETMEKGERKVTSFQIFKRIILEKFGIGIDEHKFHDYKKPQVAADLPPPMDAGVPADLPPPMDADVPADLPPPMDAGVPADLPPPMDASPEAPVNRTVKSAKKQKASKPVQEKPVNLFAEIRVGKKLRKVPKEQIREAPTIVKETSNANPMADELKKSNVLQQALESRKGRMNPDEAASLDEDEDWT